MEQLKNHLQVVAGKQDLTTQSTIYSTISRLLPQEQEMLNLKYKSTPFGKMTEDDLRLHAKGLLVKISIITGWIIPEDAAYYRILSQQFEKKLTESFHTVNPDEFEYAFRNDTQVKDWGKAMNLSLIDEVMIPYLEKRRELSQVEEQKQPKMIEHKEDMSDKSMKDWIESVKADVKGRKTTVEFMPLMVYDYLIKTGELNPTKQEKNEYLVKAVAYRHQCLLDDKNEKLNSEANAVYVNFLKMKESGVFDGEERERLIKLAKRMIMYDYLKNKE